MPLDSPDFIPEPSPGVATTLSSAVGSNTATNGGSQTTAAGVALLVMFSEVGLSNAGVRPTKVQVFDGATLWDEVDFSTPTLDQGPVLLSWLGAVTPGPIIRVTFDVNAAAVAVVATVYELDIVPGGWVHAPPQQPVPVTIVNPP